MGARGLSAEEKRVKLLEIFHETKDFFQLKELEKLGPKLKGIVSQSVKEVLQSLVDDGLVQSDKIGSSNFFWSFPSQRGTMLAQKLAQSQKARASVEVQKLDAEKEIAVEFADRRHSKARDDALGRMKLSQKRVSELNGELAQYGACDPVQVEEKRRAVVLAHEAATRWTDNFSVTASHFCKLGCNLDDIKRHFNISEVYEDI